MPKTARPVVWEGRDAQSSGPDPTQRHRTRTRPRTRTRQVGLNTLGWLALLVDCKTMRWGTFECEYEDEKIPAKEQDLYGSRIEDP
jgi:hypothetical protein